MNIVSTAYDALYGAAATTLGGAAGVAITCGMAIFTGATTRIINCFTSDRRQLNSFAIELITNIATGIIFSSVEPTGPLLAAARITGAVTPIILGGLSGNVRAVREFSETERELPDHQKTAVLKQVLLPLTISLLYSSTLSSLTNLSLGSAIGTPLNYFLSYTHTIIHLRYDHRVETIKES
jgi:hypothetical protein